MQIILVMALLAGGVVAAAAQTPVVPTPIKKGVGENAKEKVTVTWGAKQTGVIVDPGEHPVTALTRVYLSGDGTTLNNLAIEILNTLSCNPEFFVVPTGTPCSAGTGGQQSVQQRFNFSNDYVALAWVGGDYSGKRTIYRITVHEGFKDPYNVTLPGIQAPPITTGVKATSPSAVIYEIFVSPYVSAEHDSLYTFTQQADPLEAQLPTFIEKTTGALFATAGKIAGSNQFETLAVTVPTDVFQPLEKKESKTPTPVQLTAMMSVVKPPLKRAKVKVNEVAKQPVPVEEFIKQMRELVGKLSFIDARQSICAMRLADVFANRGQEIAESPTCTSKGASECREAFGHAFQTAFSESESSCKNLSVEQARTEHARSVPPPSEAAIQADAAKRFEAHKAAMTKVDDEFRKLVAAQQPERLTGESTFSNTPLTHLSFGILTSFILKGSASKPRVKAGNDGKFASDPMPRPMTMFVVNFAPKGYDAEARPMSAVERFRLFAGVIATPDFGIGGGVNIGIWKGVGFNVGGGITWVPSLREDESFGDTPKQPEDPFAAARASVLFVGASYNFK